MSDDKKIYPIGRDDKESDAVTGYMCLVDFECELGLASGGNTIYPSVEECKERRKCVDQCGIVEVEVRFKRIVQAPDYGDFDVE